MRTVLCAEGLFEPSPGISRYLDLRPATAEDPVTLLFGVRRTDPPAGLQERPHLEVATFMPGRGLRHCSSVRYDRSSYSQICRSLLSGALRPDALIVVTGQPRSSGARSLGVVSGYLQLAADAARTVVAEELSGLGEIAGAATVTAADIVVQAATPAEFRPLSAASDAVSRQIAGHILTLLPPSCTLALGAGKVADALAAGCRELRGLRLVTGALAASARDLAEAGALDPRAPVAGMSVLGDAGVTSWAAADPRVRLLPSTLIHEPAWLAAHDNLVVVLGAIAVDRVGNVNSEQAGDRLVSGLGGAPDFAAGAAGSRGGRCIVALPSAGLGGAPALRETLSRVSVPAAHVGAIVTENGAAIKGHSARQWAADLEAVF